MKAIGKRSIASMLSIFLYLVRAIICIALAGLAIVSVLALFAPAIARWAMQFEGVTIDIDDFGVDISDIIEVLSHFISFGVVLFVVNRLLEILKTLRLEAPFVKENAVRFRRVGFALIIGETATILLGIVGAIFDADLDVSLEVTNLIAIAAVFVLSEVFLEGARIKEEQDLTV